MSGCNGRMGKTIVRLCAERTDLQIVAGFDLNTEKNGDFPVYADPMEYSGSADVVIDFSNPASLERLLSYCISRRLPVVFCTTGYSEAQLQNIRHASNSIPVIKSANMSVGINLLAKLVEQAASVLGENFDLEIVERHHRMKLDAPSGTALMLADSAAKGLPHPSEYVYDRSGVRKLRDKNEIGISAVRGGTIVGEHEVIFAGTDEVIELKHSAYSRDVFANGALTAAAFLAAITEPGMYDMSDALSEILK